MMHQPYIAFAGGGTGGHLYPMLSLAAEIRRKQPRARFVFFTTDRPIDERLIRHVFDEQSAVIVSQPVKPWPRALGDWPRFYGAWRASLKRCRAEFQNDRPDVVIGSGGFGSGPAIHAARKLGITTALLNPDAIPGKANRFLASRSDVVFAQWPQTQRYFARSVRVRVTGCPIRPEFSHARRTAGLHRFNLDAARKTLLVTGASQGARSINRAVAASLGDLAGIDGWQYLHLAGTADVDGLRMAYASHSLAATVLDYTEHMPEALAVADLVVTRAGASTLAEITARGLPAVIMPYPHHRDRHQYANAAVLTEAGAAVLVEDGLTAADNAPRLFAALRGVMIDSQVRGEMARAAAVLGVPDAAERISGVVLALIANGVMDSSTLNGGSTGSGNWREKAARDDDRNSVESPIDAMA
ncbi:MAG: UDP-N-acetylglucosamine--N-acetylmuramyl-(pentapeptide) pyrophosphoryl-undecaprenol N-acetylglucosamine transferase [Phycisphaerae bacterium]